MLGVGQWQCLLLFLLSLVCSSSARDSSLRGLRILTSSSEEDEEGHSRHVKKKKGGSGSSRGEVNDSGSVESPFLGMTKLVSSEASEESIIVGGKKTILGHGWLIETKHAKSCRDGAPTLIRLTSLSFCARLKLESVDEVVGTYRTGCKLGSSTYTLTRNFYDDDECTVPTTTSTSELKLHTGKICTGGGVGSSSSSSSSRSSSGGGGSYGNLTQTICTGEVDHHLTRSYGIHFARFTSPSCEQKQLTQLAVYPVRRCVPLFEQDVVANGWPRNPAYKAFRVTDCNSVMGGTLVFYENLDCAGRGVGISFPTSGSCTRGNGDGRGGKRGSTMTTCLNPPSYPSPEPTPAPSFLPSPEPTMLTPTASPTPLPTAVPTYTARPTPTSNPTMPSPEPTPIPRCVR